MILKKIKPYFLNKNCQNKIEGPTAKALLAHTFSWD